MRHQGILTAAAAALVAGTVTAAASAATIVDSTPGLLYHLDAGVGVTSSGGAVSAWNDANANGSTFAQATAAKQPTLTAANASFNNKPTVHFDGDLTGNSGGLAPNADRLVLANSTANVQTVIVVASTAQHRNLDGIWGLNNGDTGIRRKDANTWQMTTNGGNNNDFPTSAVVNGTTTATNSLNSPAVLAFTGNATTLASTGLGEYFLVGTNTPRPWSGDLAEIAVYNRALSADEIQSISSFLGGKYSIAVAPEPASLSLFAATAALGLLKRARRR